jgi:hypothetical protein
MASLIREIGRAMIPMPPDFAGVLAALLNPMYVFAGLGLL